MGRSFTIYLDHAQQHNLYIYNYYKRFNGGKLHKLYSMSIENEPYYGHY